MTNEQTIMDIMKNEQTITDIINAIYDDIGFKGVIRFLENGVCSEVEKKEDGLYEITDGDIDESVIWDIIQPECFLSKHYVGYVCGGKYYFVEDPDIELICVLKRRGDN